jgi:hypothetical protein
VDDGQEPPGGFCVVANVAAETARGEGGLDLRRGARHFAAGAKVWVLPPQWGDGGDQLIVAGHHRGARGRGLARMVISRRHLAGFRVQGIYSPAVLRALSRPLTEIGRDHAPRLWSSRGEAEQAATSWRDRPVTARAEDGSRSFTAMVTDPPPMELTRQGQTYYLAHFNARRAIYSPHAPPAEPPTAGGCDGT